MMLFILGAFYVTMAAAEYLTELIFSGAGLIPAGRHAKVLQASVCWPLIAGTLPGVVVGSVIRVELLPSAHVLDFVVAAVLLPLGIWLALTGPARADGEAQPVRAVPLPVLILLAAVVGCVGGIYGIGGGSILAPVLIGTGGRPGKSHWALAITSG
jgi:uncharacterized protein